MDENVTAIIPAYNEEENIGSTIAALYRINGINQVIVVDDGSKDNTYKEASAYSETTVLRNEVNKGKGGAIKAALPYVLNEYVLLADADLKQSAAELEKLVNDPIRGRSAMLVAIYPKPMKKGGLGLVKGLSRKGLYVLTSKTSESVLSGQRLMHIDFLKGIKLPESFGLEFKLTLEAIRSGLNIKDIPVNIRHRETGRDLKGFLHRGRQFIQILSVLVKELI